MHGDRGRTQPNLGSLLDSQCVIIQLDVIGIDYQAAAAKKTPAQPAPQAAAAPPAVPQARPATQHCGPNSMRSRPSSMPARRRGLLLWQSATRP